MRSQDWAERRPALLPVRGLRLLRRFFAWHGLVWGLLLLCTWLVLALLLWRLDSANCMAWCKPLPCDVITLLPWPIFLPAAAPRAAAP